MNVAWLTRDQSGLIAPNPAHLSPRTAKIRGVAVHWIGTPNPVAHPSQTWGDLQRQAMSGANVNHEVYGDIEYNAGFCESVAHPGNGTILAGRDNHWNGAHAVSKYGVANHVLLGIALVSNEVTAPALHALQAYIYCAYLGRDQSVPFVLEGHKDLENVGGIATSCPGDDLHNWVTVFRETHGWAVL